ncbi:structural cement protein Gp24 [Candidatus Pantoea multigeneris]|uniref:Bacteriophage protein n=1 Tax=Candidatus Pantoea multigeneris TaxID=2608357 RepID=A0ABX0R666_9GAMM|nr:hypothetical protein [Pantoea multigeneris]NIF20269.1 hypothetical protein [Pantoea multigeneris]
MTSILLRMPVGIAGAISRPQDLTVEPALLDATLAFPDYGLPGKFTGNSFVPLVAGDTAAAITGFLVRPYPTTSNADFNHQLASGGDLTGGLRTGDILKRGYMTVNVGADATGITRNAPVYCKLAGGALTPDAPAEGDATVVAVPNAVFTGAGDADGNAEISYKI